MKTFFITLGCKVNQYETQLMKELLMQQGFSSAEDVGNADIIIFNSCTVTSTSDHKVIKMINKVKRENPSAIIVLTGCMTQAASQETIGKLVNADVILGNSNRTDLPGSIKKFLDTHEQVINIKKYDTNTKFETQSIIKEFSGRTRAFIKIEDGCNRFCSYCIIPYARGRVRSKSLQDVVCEANKLAKSSYKELVLVGINLSAYGMDLGLDLCDVIEKIAAIDGIERIRLGSLEPEKLSLPVIKRLSRQEKLCPQFHLSLQSGCDETLKRMNRHYSSDDYHHIVSNLRANFKNPSITTDIMVGFPGETDEEFCKSAEFVRKIGFAKMHVFSYSRRPGTKAAVMENQVSSQVKSQRSREMCRIELDMRKSFLESQIGRVEPVLIETKNKNRFFRGYTMNYTPVIIESTENLCNKIINVNLDSLKRHENELVLCGRGERYDLIL